MRLEARGANMSDQLKVRIGITTKNRPEYLPKCLGSCLAQTYEPKEIVVWDDSDDPEVLKQTEAIKRQFPQVRWIQPNFRTTCNQARRGTRLAQDRRPDRGHSRCGVGSQG